jgi:short-subunit dehydrogenase
LSDRQRFAGIVAVVTGASAGIGAAAARAFAREGAKVVVAARGAEPLRTIVDEIEAAGGRALAVATDVAVQTQCEALLRAAAEAFGGVDVLVNNAAANRRGSIESYRADELANVVTVNLTAPIVLSRLALPYLRQSRAPAIVNVASLAGRMPLVHEAVYSATKFGLRAFTMALAEELAGSSVRVSVVSPGPVDTGFIGDDLDNVPDLVFSQPMSTAEEIAELILDCAADGKLERTRPRLGAYLATIGYVFPSLRRAVLPLMERRGRKAKEKFRSRRSE